jgi:hypothetical protein
MHANRRADRINDTRAPDDIADIIATGIEAKLDVIAIIHALKIDVFSYV